MPNLAYQADFQAWAVNLALELEFERFNKPAIRQLARQLTPKERIGLERIWATGGPVARKALIALTAYAPVKSVRAAGTREKISNALVDMLPKTPLALAICSVWGALGTIGLITLLIAAGG